MTKTLLLSAIIFLLSCQSPDKTQPSPGSGSAAAQTLESFADSLVRLDKYSLESIEKAADYYQRLVPADSSLADSAAVLFLRHVLTVADSTNQKLYQDTTDYFDLIYNQNQNVSPAQKQFQQRLMNNHLLLQGDGEGGVYAVPDYDWMNSLLIPKTSLAVDHYLTLLSKEEKNPALLDAGLAIEATELADRLVSSERLLEQKLPTNFMEDVKRKNKFYTGTLLFGSDNSPALEYNEITLTEQYAKSYDYLLATYPASKAAQIIKEWQTIVKSKNSKQVEAWRKRYNPYE
ncbi:MAG TPA: hypothetical protein VGB71_08365 [Flavisolibacter sp.]